MHNCFRIAVVFLHCTTRRRLQLKLKLLKLKLRFLIVVGGKWLGEVLGREVMAKVETAAIRFRLCLLNYVFTIVVRIAVVFLHCTARRCLRLKLKLLKPKLRFLTFVGGKWFGEVLGPTWTDLALEGSTGTYCRMVLGRLN